MNMHQYHPDKDPKFPLWLVLFAVGCMICAVTMVLSGCSSKLTRAERKITRIATKVPGSIIKPCNIFIPPLITKDSMHIVYRSGIPVITHDTVVTTDENTRIVTRTIKEKVTVHDTVLQERYREVVDNKVVQLERQKTEQAIKERDASQLREAKLETKRNMWRLIALCLGAYMVVRIIVRMYFKINLP